MSETATVAPAVTQATPRPWVWAYHNRDGKPGEPFGLITDDEKKDVLLATDSPDGRVIIEIRDADAAFLLRAVNSIDAAKAAISHVLNALVDDPRKFWLMGDGTGSYEKLTAAASVLWDIPKEKIQNDFRPREAKWKQYIERMEADERRLEALQTILRSDCAEFLPVEIQERMAELKHA